MDVVKRCLQMQLEELEIISSIFCGPREMVLDDAGVVVDLQDFVTGKESFLNRQLDYRIFVTLSGFKDRLEVFVELPHYYPALELPTVTVSYPNISTNQHNLIKSLVNDALRNLQQSEETFLFQFISWIQDAESIKDVLSNTTVPAERSNKRTTPDKEGDKLERLWIYSHHIKSKRKRSKIVENARDLQLTGFSLPGKPGIICVEGLRKDTQEFWRLLKAMHWQKIQVRLEENSVESGENALNKFRKFSKFEEETSFTVANSCSAAAAAGDNDYDDDDDNNEDENDNSEVLRLNMSTFNTFLEQHECPHVMSSLFGFK